MGRMGDRFANLSFDAPFIRLERGAKSLHFTLGEVQSRMRLDRPDALQIDYTRTMMGFLLLVPQPRHIAMIGLGGGSLVKFCHRHLPATRITVVENNPAVIALRGEFNIPDDDARLTVLADDGAAWLAHAPAGSIDVLLVDGFGARGQPAQLCSQAFYDDGHAALASGGVMVVNLHTDDTQHDDCLARITHRFGANAVVIPALEKSNCIVLAGRDVATNPETLRSSDWAQALDATAQQALKTEMARIGWEAATLPRARIP